MQSALGLGACPPQKKILDFRPSEIISGAILRQNSSTMVNQLSLTARASYPCYEAIQTNRVLIVCVTLQPARLSLTLLNRFSEMMPSWNRQNWNGNTALWTGRIYAMHRLIFCHVSGCARICVKTSSTESTTVKTVVTVAAPTALVTTTNISNMQENVCKVHMLTIENDY